MLKKLMPVMAAPAISTGIRSLIWGYISNPAEEKNPNAKKNEVTTARLASGGINIKTRAIAARTARQKTMIHLRVLKTRSESAPQKGLPIMMPTVINNITLPVFTAE